MAMKLLETFLDEMEDDEIVKCVQGLAINHFGDFRIDRQGALVKGPPDYWRIAVQSNDQAKATVIKNFTRTRPGGGSYTKSKPVFAYFLSEVDTVATAKTIREAFYASIVVEVPEKLCKWWNEVKIDKEGSIHVTACPEYVAWLAQEAEKGGREKKKLEKKKKPVGKKARAKGKGFGKEPKKDKEVA